jgi:hypothetical protein
MENFVRQFWKVAWKNVGELDFAIAKPLISDSPLGRMLKYAFLAELRTQTE